jgi:hypothetical protein
MERLCLVQALEEAPTGVVEGVDFFADVPRGYLQGYNARPVCNEQQIVLAAEISVSSADFGQLGPMITAAEHELTAAGITTLPEVVLADAGYWHKDPIEAIVARGLRVLIPPDADKRRGTRPGWDGGGRHQVQPPHRPLAPPRPSSRPIGMATDHRKGQPPQGPPPPPPTRKPPSQRARGPVRTGQPATRTRPRPRPGLRRRSRPRRGSPGSRRPGRRSTLYATASGTGGTESGSPGEPGRQVTALSGTTWESPPPPPSDIRTSIWRRHARAT